MAIGVLVLRVFLLFLNVYDTFKTLKYPPPSARNGGRPSTRALTARKREMKGCLAVWIVWCYLAVYERLLESFVSIFVPFYDEFKSIALLFFIFSRARGAEPIYLHIIRPFLKPYTPTIDLILDFARLVGDTAFSALKFPSRWWFGHEDDDSDTQSDNSLQSGTNLLRPYPTNPQNIQSTSTPSLLGPGVDSNPHAHSNGTNTRHFSDEAIRTLPQQQFVGDNAINREIPASLQPGNGSANTKSYEFWQPPASAYQQDADGGPNTSVEIRQIEEWRQYPPFPSAYPNTPIARRQRGLPMDRQQQPAIWEDTESISDLTTEQGFRQSSKLIRQSSTPDWTEGLGDENSTTATLQASGVVSYKGVFTEEEGVGSMDVDEDEGADPMEEDGSEYEEDEEDEFNVTLRTPQAPVRYSSTADTRRVLHSAVLRRQRSINDTRQAQQLPKETTLNTNTHVPARDASTSPSVAGQKRRRSDSSSRDPGPESEDAELISIQPPSPVARRPRSTTSSASSSRTRGSDEDTMVAVQSDQEKNSTTEDSPSLQTEKISVGSTSAASDRSKKSTKLPSRLPKRRRVAESDTKEASIINPSSRSVPTRTGLRSRNLDPRTSNTMPSISSGAQTGTRQTKSKPRTADRQQHGDRDSQETLGNAKPALRTRSVRKR